MSYIVTRDQAVWERETLLVSILDDTPDDEIDEAIYEALTEGRHTEYAETEVIDVYEGADTVIWYEKET